MKLKFNKKLKIVLVSSFLIALFAPVSLLALSCASDNNDKHHDENSPKQFITKEGKKVNLLSDNYYLKKPLDQQSLLELKKFEQESSNSLTIIETITVVSEQNSSPNSFTSFSKILGNFLTPDLEKTIPPIFLSFLQSGILVLEQNEFQQFLSLFKFDDKPLKSEKFIFNLGDILSIVNGGKPASNPIVGLNFSFAYLNSTSLNVDANPISNLVAIIQGLHLLALKNFQINEVTKSIKANLKLLTLSKILPSLVSSGSNATNINLDEIADDLGDFTFFNAIK